MQLGISSFTYGWNVGVPGNMPPNPFTEMDLIERTMAFGLSVLQLGDNLPLHEFDGRRLSLLKNRLKQNNLQLEIGARSMNRENLDRYILLAVKTEARLLRFVVDGNNYQPPIDAIEEVLAHAVPRLEKYDITLAVENHDRIGVYDLAALVKSVNSRYLAVCLDTVNSIGKGEGLETVVTALAPHTVNLHIKDYRIKRLSHHMGFLVEGSIAGKGMLEIPGLVEKLKIHNKCRTAILEQWVIPEENIADTVIKEEQWATESIAYLKSVID